MEMEEKRRGRKPKSAAEGASDTGDQAKEPKVRSFRLTDETVDS